QARRRAVRPRGEGMARHGDRRRGARPHTGRHVWHPRRHGARRARLRGADTDGRRVGAPERAPAALSQTVPRRVAADVREARSIGRRSPLRYAYRAPAATERSTRLAPIEKAPPWVQGRRGERGPEGRSGGGPGPPVSAGAGARPIVAW